MQISKTNLSISGYLERIGCQKIGQGASSAELRWSRLSGLLSDWYWCNFGWSLVVSGQAIDWYLKSSSWLLYCNSTYNTKISPGCLPSIPCKQVELWDGGRLILISCNCAMISALLDSSSLPGWAFLNRYKQNEEMHPSWLYLTSQQLSIPLTMVFFWINSRNW